MTCPCSIQCHEECEICRDTDTIRKGEERMNGKWITIICPKCGREGNYTKTVSGTAPCDNPRCHELLKVGKI